MRLITTTVSIAWILLSACNSPNDHEAGRSRGPASGSFSATEEGSPMNDANSPENSASAASTETATFGAGCFWCVEAVLEQLDGVHDVVSGYMGGSVDDPTYEQVCSGTTGHAEVVQVVFDPSVIGYEKLVRWFFELHDPTTLNRQGADVGTQYRSAIFYHSPEQKQTAERVRDELAASDKFGDPIVTEISEASEFWLADPKHQDFYANNPSYGYCRVVIRPKLDKLGLEK